MTHNGALPLVIFAEGEKLNYLSTTIFCGVALLLICK
jgi:hypothetical protein